MDKLMEADISNGAYETYLPDLQTKFADVSKDEVLKRVAALEFNHFLKYYENSDDLNAKTESRERRDFNSTRDNGDRRERPTFNRSDNGYSRLFINLGTKDGFYKASFLQFILDESNLSKEVLGKIDIREMNAWIEVDKSAAPKMIRSLDGKKYNGRLVRMNEADGGFKRPSDEGRSEGRSDRTEARKRIPMRMSR
jgi:ATP-dependent RNA helicase DeaD